MLGKLWAIMIMLFVCVLIAIVFMLDVIADVVKYILNKSGM